MTGLRQSIDLSVPQYLLKSHSTKAGTWGKQEFLCDYVLAPDILSKLYENAANKAKGNLARLRMTRRRSPATAPSSNSASIDVAMVRLLLESHMLVHRLTGI